MHLAPLTGIETGLDSSSSTTVTMHLAPLTGIETVMTIVSAAIVGMHLAPLTGIETHSTSPHICWPIHDASRAPYGD